MSNDYDLIIRGGYVVDGSGLSRSDRTSPREVVTLLEHMSGEAAGPAFESSLAVAGRSGTLSHRMRRTAARNVRASSQSRPRMGSLLRSGRGSRYATMNRA